MLAEIFITKLEAAARSSQEPIMSSSSTFVPFTGGSEHPFKDGFRRSAAAAPAERARIANLPAARKVAVLRQK
jgi:hypothetical protein